MRLQRRLGGLIYRVGLLSGTYTHHLTRILSSGPSRFYGLPIRAIPSFYTHSFPPPHLWPVYRFFLLFIFFFPSLESTSTRPQALFFAYHIILLHVNALYYRDNLSAGQNVFFFFIFLERRRTGNSF